MNSIQEVISHKNGRLATLFQCLEEVTDPRYNRNKRYSLISILMIAICAHIGGADNWVEVEEFGVNHKDWFETFLDLPNGIPSHDTFNRVFSILDHFELKFWLLLWLEDAVSKVGQQVTIDGKVIKAWSSKNPLTIVRAWSATSRIVLEQVRVPRGHNEILAIDRLLDLLNLEGKVVTIDAIGTQRKFAHKITKKGGDYVLPVKKNQHSLYADLAPFLDAIVSGELDYVEYDSHETVDNDHGRFETRRCYSTNEFRWLPQRKLWASLKSVSVIETIMHRNGRTSVSKRYYISSLPPEASTILSMVRNHWSIENNLHYSLDVNFLEDRSTIRKGFGPRNFSLLRSIVASLLDRDPSEGSIKRKRARANCNPQFLMQVLENKGD